jgi:hypothetical protein
MASVRRKPAPLLFKSSTRLCHGTIVCTSSSKNKVGLLLFLFSPGTSYFSISKAYVIWLEIALIYITLDQHVSMEDIRNIRLNAVLSFSSRQHYPQTTGRVNPPLNYLSASDTFHPSPIHVTAFRQPRTPRKLEERTDFAHNRPTDIKPDTMSAQSYSHSTGQTKLNETNWKVKMDQRTCASDGVRAVRYSPALGTTGSILSRQGRKRDGSTSETYPRTKARTGCALYRRVGVPVHDNGIAFTGHGGAPCVWLA